MIEYSVCTYGAIYHAPRRLVPPRSYLFRYELCWIITLIRDVYNRVAPSGGSLALAPAKAVTSVYDSDRIAICKRYTIEAKENITRMF